MGNTDEVKRKEKSRLCEGQGANAARSGDRPGPTNGHWRDVDWLFCRDGKWRPVEPGTFPLVDGAPARVGRLRGYGNAIVAQQAQAFIEAYLDTTAPRCTGKHHDYH
jgi:DNA (cytosine-5)-methyltransferase 1